MPPKKAPPPASKKDKAKVIEDKVCFSFFIYKKK